MTESNVDFVLMRTFDAPPEQVFKAMTERDHLAKWWGPQGCSIDVLRHEAVPGGVFHYRMGFGPAVEMYGRFDFRELTAPSKIVFVNGFADAQGERAQHPMAAGWPLEMLVTVTLQALEGKTAMTLRVAPENASESERQVFRANHVSLQQGFGGTYEVLEKYIGTLANA